MIRTYSTIRVVAAILVACALGLSPAAWGETKVVTVQELIDANHHITVPAGTVIEWRDAHFDTVWLPPSNDGPRVERRNGAFTTTFRTPGMYRGRFTVAGGHRSNDVYPFTVTVTGR